MCKMLFKCKLMRGKAKDAELNLNMNSHYTWKALYEQNIYLIFKSMFTV